MIYCHVVTDSKFNQESWSVKDLRLVRAISTQDEQEDGSVDEIVQITETDINEDTIEISSSSQRNILTHDVIATYANSGSRSDSSGHNVLVPFNSGEDNAHPMVDWRCSAEGGTGDQNSNDNSNNNHYISVPIPATKTKAKTNTKTKPKAKTKPKSKAKTKGPIGEEYNIMHDDFLNTVTSDVLDVFMAVAHTELEYNETGLAYLDPRSIHGRVDTHTVPASLLPCSLNW